MKNQRWPNDQQTIAQEFRSSRRQEQMGMNEDNMNRGNDYIARDKTEYLDYRQSCELEPSWTTQLDIVGMQPHSREYVERDLVSMRSGRKYEMIAGQEIDYPEGIQFSGCP